MPRTQTNDAALPGNRMMFRLADGRVGASPAALFTMTRANTQAVVVSMDICNTSAGTGDQLAITIGSGGTYIFGGLTGSGVFDTFSYRGNLVLRPGEALWSAGIIGTWYFNCNGFFQPWASNG